MFLLLEWPSVTFEVLFEPVHVMCDQQSLRSACAYAQTDQSICSSLEYSMIVKLLTEHHLELIVKLLTEHHLEFLSLKGGCRGSSESTLVKMSNC